MARGWGASSSSGGSGARHHGAIDRARVEAEDERAPTRPHHNPTDANTHTHTLTYSRRPSRHAGDKSTPCAAHASSSRRENTERGPSPSSSPARKCSPCAAVQSALGHALRLAIALMRPCHSSPAHAGVRRAAR